MFRSKEPCALPLTKLVSKKNKIGKLVSKEIGINDNLASAFAAAAAEVFSSRALWFLQKSTMCPSKEPY